VARSLTRRWLALAAALLLLDASVTFENIWPTPGVRWSGQLSIELAAVLSALILLAALRQVRVPKWAVAAISGLWMVLVLGRYADVTAQALFGRDINLYWDLQFIPDVAAMITRVASVWLIVFSVAAAAAILAALYALLWWAWRQAATGAADPRQRRVLAVVALVLMAGFAWERTAGAPANPHHAVGINEEYVEPAPPLFPPPVTATYARQARFVYDALSRPSPLPPSPAMDSDLGRLRDADVFVVFIESYGAVSYERRDIADGLVPTRARLEAAIRETGRGVVSAYVESPTFGGSSWLAHVSFLSGIEVRDPERNARLMIEHRDTLVRAFARRGFRTVALMPGLRQRWPEGTFYGFDEMYGADRLAYTGPEFGWFAIPDQFSLFALDRLEANRSPRQPLFVFFPTISTHFPFIPTPPYQPDWPRMADGHPYDSSAIVHAYAREPDWTHFGPGYVDAMSYDLQTIAGYLRQHADRDLVMVLIGDHQPAAAVTGAGATWNVPVHIVANRRGILDRLAASGFREGLTPSRPALSRMHALTPVLLDAFGGQDGQAPADVVRSQPPR
jgi:sulfatase-like protein